MSFNGTSIPNQLYLIGSSTNRYGSLVVFLLGSVGVLLNILIFSTDQDLNKTPCSRFFLASSIASGVVLFLGLPTRFLNSFGLDPTERYDIWCKCYVTILLGSFSCSALFTAFLSVERWLNSCANAAFRMFLSMKNTYRIIIATIIVVFISYSQAFYCYLANQKTPRGACSPINSVCLYANDFIHLFLFVILPCVIMLIFGSLTLYNVQLSVRRVAPGPSVRITQNERRTMRTQSTLTILMLTQICLLTFCNLPAGIQKIYSTATANDYKSPDRRAVESVTFQFVYLFTYVGVGLPFYLYTLVGAVFRESLLRRIQKIVRRRPAHREIHTMATGEQVAWVKLRALPTKTT